MHFSTLIATTATITSFAASRSIEKRLTFDTTGLKTCSVNPDCGSPAYTCGNAHPETKGYCVPRSCIDGWTLAPQNYAANCIPVTKAQCGFSKIACVDDKEGHGIAECSYDPSNKDFGCYITSCEQGYNLIDGKCQGSTKAACGLQATKCTDPTSGTGSQVGANGVSICAWNGRNNAFECQAKCFDGFSLSNGACKSK